MKTIEARLESVPEMEYLMIFVRLCYMFFMFCEDVTPTIKLTIL